MSLRKLPTLAPIIPIIKAENERGLRNNVNRVLLFILYNEKTSKTKQTII
jgi:hypothetical protein